MFLRNQWYVVAWDTDVGRAPLGRMICGEPILLFRKLDGTAVALQDVCPHRLLPLSQGKVEGDNIRCGYHGIMFDGAGSCVEMPAQAEPNRNLKVKIYPLIERYRFLWVWIGEAEKADPALMPDFWCCEHPDWTFDGGTYHINCDYRLMIDNLMDLTHETYVHPDSIGQVEISSSPIEVKTENEHVFLSRWMLGIDAPPFWRTALRKPGKVDRWQICEFMLPSNVLIDVGVALTGTGAREGNRSQGVNGIVVDSMTPETETTCWYHWGMARNFDVKNAGFTQRFKEQQAKVFSEDVAILEAQQRSMNANPSLRLRNFNIDAGGVQSRILIDKALKAQSTEKPVAA